jgi:dolichyl-phosphate beta-glucosyltransferase
MYNEARIVEASVSTLGAYMTEHFPAGTWEAIYVSDGSKDDTRALCAAAAAAFPGVRAEGYETNRGKGGAVRYGMGLAEGEIIFFTDCDLAYGVEVIGRAYEGFKDAPEDILIGSRRIGKDGYEAYTRVRKLMSGAYHHVVNIAAGFKHSDSQCGFKAFKKAAAKEIFPLCEINGFAFDLEALILGEALGFTVVEFPVKIINHNESTVHVFRDTYRMLRDIRIIKKSVKRKLAAKKGEKI